MTRPLSGNARAFCALAPAVGPAHLSSGRGSSSPPLNAREEPNLRLTEPSSPSDGLYSAESAVATPL